MNRKLLLSILSVIAVNLVTACKSGDQTQPIDPGPGKENNPSPGPGNGENPGIPEEPFKSNSKDSIALQTTKRIQDYHSPFGLVFAAQYNDVTGKDLFRWDAVADSAIWSGTYLAALAFNYKVTKSPEVLNESLRVLEAVRKISLINGDGLLSRHFYPVDGKNYQAYLNDNADLANTLRKTFEGTDYIYLTRTSRDQYAGIFFGLAVAYDLLDDKAAKELIRKLVTSLTNYLLDHQWTTLNPDGSIRTTFAQKPDQQLSILQVARHINPEKFTAAYEKLRASSASKVWLPLYIEGIEPENSYFKFNLNHVYIYNLVRLEEKDSPFLQTYKDAYEKLFDSVKGHGNAHFNLVDLSIRGPDVERDQQTIKMIDQLFARGFKQSTVDVRGKYTECRVNKACDAIPVSDRVRSTFVWQTPPWDLYLEGDDRIESPGVDVLLSYWMSRYYRLQ